MRARKAKTHLIPMTKPEMNDFRQKASGAFSYVARFQTKLYPVTCTDPVTGAVENPENILRWTIEFEMRGK